MKIEVANKNILKSIYLKKVIYFLLVTMLYVACNSDEHMYINKNHNIEIIEKKTMVLMLVDIHIADSYLSINPTAGKDKIKAVDFYYSIFDKYGYTKDQFKYSIDIYSQKPKEFEQMYEDVLQRLKSLNVEL